MMQWALSCTRGTLPDFSRRGNRAVCTNLCQWHLLGDIIFLWRGSVIHIASAEFANMPIKLSSMHVWRRWLNKVTISKGRGFFAVSVVYIDLGYPWCPLYRRRFYAYLLLKFSFICSRPRRVRKEDFIKKADTESALGKFEAWHATQAHGAHSPKSLKTLIYQAMHSVHGTSTHTVVHVEWSNQGLLATLLQGCWYPMPAPE